MKSLILIPFLSMSLAACAVDTTEPDDAPAPTAGGKADGQGGGECSWVPYSLHPVTARVDGDVYWDGLYSDQTALYMSPTEPNLDQPVTLRVRTFAGDVEEAGVLVFDGATNQDSRYVMTRDGRDPTGRFEYWKATLPGARATRWYRFELRDGGRFAYYNGCGPSTTDRHVSDFWIVPGFHPPAWARRAVFYQIFPDRFFDGDRSNDPAGTVDWSAAPTTGNFFGGDLEGVRAKLSYLADLGVDSIYMTPVFASPSNHKYDASSYADVDPAFGGNAALDRLIGDAHARGMKVVLDGAFNHVHPQHAWFDVDARQPDLGAFEHGQQQPASPFFDRFTFDGSACGYASFFGFCSMAKLDFAAASLQRDMWQGSGSIVQRWLAAPHRADGWRLDTGHMLGERGHDGQNNRWILSQMRAATKAQGTGKLLIAETDWGADQTPWLGGDTVDGVMNYKGFGMPITDYVNGRDIMGSPVKLDAKSLDSWLHGTLARGPLPAMLTHWNSLGTHDIPRFLERSGGDTWKLFEATIFQMTYVGVPVVYYGDEVGMRGGADPDNRRSFPWDQASWNGDVRSLTRTLIALRKSLPALQEGGLFTLVADPTLEVYAFARATSDRSGQVVVVLSNGPSTVPRVDVPVWYASIPDGAVLTDRLSGRRFEVRDGVVSIDNLWGHYGAVLTATP